MEEIISLLNKAIWLLKECNYPDKALWFEEKVSDLKAGNKKEINNTLEEIKYILAGMGSFSDLPLIPKEGSNLNESDARYMQWDLVEQLGDKITYQIKNA